MIQPRMVESREGKRKRRIKVNKIQKGKQNTNLRAEEKIEEEKEKIEEERVMWKKLRKRKRNGERRQAIMKRN